MAVESISVCCPDCGEIIEVGSYDFREGEILGCPNCGLEIALYKSKECFYAALERSEQGLPREYISESIYRRKLSRKCANVLRELRYFDKRNPQKTVGYRQDISSGGLTYSIYIIEAKKIVE